MPPSIDIRIDGGAVVTMDPERRVLADSSVAVDDGRILAVGPTDEMRRRYRARKVIDARRKAVMPGLIDLHAHAGTALLRQIGERLPSPNRRNSYDFISYHTSAEWWHVEALLASLERLRFGTTTSLYMLGMAPRGDSPEVAYRNAEAVEAVGLRAIVGVGPSRPPWPREYGYWEKGRRVERRVTLEETFEKTAEAIAAWKGRNSAKVQMWVSASRLMNPNPADQVYDPANEKYIRPQADGIRRIMEDHGVGFHVHAYGTAVKYAKEQGLGLLGPKTVLAHGWPFDDETVDILAETDTRVVHCPRARRVYFFGKGRLPLPELIDRGVIVGLGSDYVGSDRTWNLWEDIYWAPRIHRRLKNDPTIIPVGKILEMATIDGARAIGMDDRIGSIEPGKDADIIVVDTWTPHGVPLAPELWTHRLAYYARGHDVETVMVKGEVLMEDRKVLSVDEDEVLEWADAEARHTVEVFGLQPFMEPSESYWKHSRW